MIPAGITTATVHLDAPISFTGEPGRLHVVIEPSTSLIWTATGTPLGHFVDIIDLNPGVELRVELPHTDQPGFEDGFGNTFTGWYYTATVVYEKDGRRIDFPARTFQLLSGQDEVDLALIPAGEAEPVPAVAPILPVTSLDGLTGAVTKTMLGLNKVNNTTDLEKPISTLVAEALSGKSNTGHTHSITNVTGLQGALDQKADASAMTTALGLKLDESKALTDYVQVADGALYASKFGVNKAGNTDTQNTAALQAAVDAAIATGRQLYINGVVYINAPIIFGVTGGSGTTGWKVGGFSKGNARIVQRANNVPIFHFKKEYNRQFKVHDIAFHYETPQTPSAGYMGSAILFDTDTALNYGHYNAEFHSLTFHNAYRSIANNADNVNTIPVWGMDFYDLQTSATCTGALLRLVQTSSGQPNVTIRKVYVRGDSMTERAINLQGIHVLTMSELEFNDCVTEQLFVSTCDAVTVRGIRSERGTLTANNTSFWTFSASRAHVQGMEVQNSICLGNSRHYVTRAVVGSQVSYDTGTVYSRTDAEAYPGGGSLVFVGGTDAKLIEWSGGYNAPDGTAAGVKLVGKYSASDGGALTNTAINIIRDGNYFPSMGMRHKELSGAGKRTVADADFPNTPANGAEVIVRDTTANIARKAMRVNGAWVYTPYFSSDGAPVIASAAALWKLTVGDDGALTTTAL